MVGGRKRSYHDGFESWRRHRLIAVDFTDDWSPDVEIETILADRVLGVPHVRADKVAVRVVDRLHASVANVVGLVRVCHTHRHSPLHVCRA